MLKSFIAIAVAASGMLIPGIPGANALGSQEGISISWLPNEPCPYGSCPANPGTTITIPFWVDIPAGDVPLNVQATVTADPNLTLDSVTPSGFISPGSIQLSPNDPNWEGKEFDVTITIPLGTPAGNYRVGVTFTGSPGPCNGICVGVGAGAHTEIGVS